MTDDDRPPFPPGFDLAGVMAMAEGLAAIYRAFINAGFPEQRAFEFVMRILVGATTQQSGQEGGGD